MLGFMLLVAFVGIGYLAYRWLNNNHGSLPRNSWSWPTIPTWAWWVVVGVISLITLYFLVPWLMGLVGTSGGEGEASTSSNGDWFVANWKFLTGIFIVLVLAVIRLRGYGGGGLTAVIVVACLVIFLLGKRAPEAVERVQDWATAGLLDESPPKKKILTASDPNTEIHEPKWERLPDGSIPLGVWSETLPINVGCKTFYDAGVGTDFNVRYRFYSKEWSILNYGTYPSANEVQVMLLKPRSTTPVRITCR
jgi:hypothetical protein